MYTRKRLSTAARRVTRPRATARRAPARKAAPARRVAAPRAARKLDYPGVGSSLGAMLGGTLGGPAGAALGGVLGGGAQSLLKSITGFGDYEITHNSVSLGRDTVPLFGNGKRSTIVRHREYIQDIITSATPGAFKSDVFPINPAQAITFPWGNRVGSSYDQYRVHGMVFEYKTMSSDALNSTNTALGTVVMATQYNVMEAPFTNKQQMENYEFGASVKPSMCLMHPIECAQFQTPVDVLFTRPSTISPGDLRLYDMGNFTIATQGLQGSSVNIGELWVSYEIEFIKPCMNVDSPFAADHFIIPDPANITTARYFGLSPTTIVASGSSNFGAKLSSPGIITLPPNYVGGVMIYYVVSGTADTGTLFGPQFTVGPGVSAQVLLDNNTRSSIITPFSVLSTTQSGVVSGWAAFDVTLPGGVISLTAADFSAMTAYDSCDLIVSTFPQTLIN